GQRRAERPGDPFFHKPGPKADTKVAREDLADVFRFTRRQSVEQLAQRLGLLLDGPLLIGPDEDRVYGAQRSRAGIRVSLENFLDDIADIAVSHVGFTQRLLVDLRQVANGVADHGVTQVQLSLIAVGERPGRKVHRREREGLVIERGEIFAQQARLFQLAGGGADRLTRASKCLHGRLALLDLVGGRSGDGFAGVVPVEGERDVLPTTLGFDVLDRVAIALPDVRIESVAILVLGGRVPGLALRQVLLADILLVAGASAGRGIDAGRALRCHPLGVAWG